MISGFNLFRWLPHKFPGKDKLIEISLQAGADDVQSSGKLFEVTCDPTNFEMVAKALQEARIPTDVSEITRISANSVELGVDDARRVLSLVGALEEHEDVQSVTANYSIPDELMEAVAAGLE